MAMATTVTGSAWWQESLAAISRLHEAIREDAELIWAFSRAAKIISQALVTRKIVADPWQWAASPADAQHLAAEFVGRYRIERRSLPALASDRETASTFDRRSEMTMDSKDVLPARLRLRASGATC